MKAARLFLTCVLILALLAACAPAGPNPVRQATVDALARRVEQTATAAAANVSEPKAAQATAEIKATTLAQDQVATQSAQGEVDTEAVKATQVAERPVKAELRLYGVDSDKGKVAWIHPPLTLEAEGSSQFAADNLFPGVIAADFVISADITWDTRGDSGCGFVVRSNGDQKKSSQYLIGLTRFANGHVGFLVTVDGEMVNALDLYPKRFDNQFQAQNLKTNKLTVVGRGYDFEIYTNETLIGTLNPNNAPVLPNLPNPPAPPADKDNPVAQSTFTAAQTEYQQQTNDMQALFRERVKLFKESDKEFERGFVSFVVFTQTGKSTCTFDNAWLWLIEE
jgi:hypothetical protein